MDSPRFIFFGTPALAVTVLEELEKAHLLPLAIVTTPDKPAGRGLEVTPSPVKVWATTHSSALFQPSKLDENFGAELAKLAPELFVVAAYGKIIPEHILSIPKKGVLNVHPSLLPRYRGPSPIESQILADEKEMGVSVILLDEQVDHGPILGQKSFSIPEPLDRVQVNDLLWHAGGELLASILPAWIDGTLSSMPQDDNRATFTKKIQKEDGEIDLTGDPRQNYLKYLAYQGWPGVYFFKNGKRIKVTKATYENGKFVILRVVPEGKPEMEYQS